MEPITDKVLPKIGHTHGSANKDKNSFFCTYVPVYHTVCINSHWVIIDSEHSDGFDVTTPTLNDLVW